MSAYPAPHGCKFRIAAEQIAANAASGTPISDYSELAHLSLLLAEAADMRTEARGGNLVTLPGATGRIILADAARVAKLAEACSA